MRYPVVYASQVGVDVDLPPLPSADPTSIGVWGTNTSLREPACEPVRGRVLCTRVCPPRCVPVSCPWPVPRGQHELGGESHTAWPTAERVVSSGRGCHAVLRDQPINTIHSHPSPPRPIAETGQSTQHARGVAFAWGAAWSRVPSPRATAACMIYLGSWCFPPCHPSTAIRDTYAHP